MNRVLSDFARDWLKENLAKCTERQQDLFKRMYCPKHPDWTIERCVDAMPESKFDWAIDQVERTLKKNAASVVSTDDDGEAD